MTDTLKEMVRTMRLQGIGYGTIAKRLNLHENNVQLYCKTHGLAGDVSLVKHNYAVWCEKNNRCPVCGSRLIQKHHGRRKKFCSGRCRVKYCRDRTLYE